MDAAETYDNWFVDSLEYDKKWARKQLQDDTMWRYMIVYLYTTILQGFSRFTIDNHNTPILEFIEFIDGNGYNITKDYTPQGMNVLISTRGDQYDRD